MFYKFQHVLPTSSFFHKNFKLRSTCVFYTSLFCTTRMFSDSIHVLSLLLGFTNILWQSSTITCLQGTCWESWLSLNQNPQVLVNDCIARDKDPWEAVSPCHETHGERWFIQYLTIFPQRKPNLYQTRDLCFDTTCWESRLSINKNPQVLVNDRIAKYKDPWEVVSPCRETH